MKHCWVGIDFGKTNVRFGIAEDTPVLTHYAKRPYSRTSPESFIRDAVGGIEDALETAGYSADGVSGIGMAVPAVVDRRTGSVVWGPDWDFMAGASLVQPVARHFRVPVVADVDTVMPTWGENWAGAGRTCGRFAVLAWGTGLGAGLVMDGKVQEYPGNLFPEFGHSRVSDDDWPCKCGGRGCVDTMVCGGGIARHGRLAVEGNRNTILRDMCGNTPGNITAAMVFDAADRGDREASAILDRVAVLLGRLCANVVLTVQPEKIVIVGGLGARARALLGRINETMNEGCWLLRRGLTRCEAVCSELGDRAGVLGAIRKVQVGVRA